MRKRLMAAAAMAPLMIGAPGAYAQSTLTISSNTSTPVATATAVSGGPGDVVVASGATFTINDTTPAITLNSNNAVTNNGTITSKNIDGATGILVQGPFTGTVLNASSINLTEDFTSSDSANNDGLTEAPYAQGKNRIGIRVTGPFTGDITNIGSIVVQGNNSTGISIESQLTGNLLPGGIGMTGDNNIGLHTTGEITGDVVLSSAMAVKGQNSVGVQIEAPIDGSLKIYAGLTTSGYAVNARETGAILTNIQKTPADVQQGGSAVVVAGNVLHGVFLGAPPSTTVSTDTTTDADGDGVVDSVETASSLTTYGSAPALKIGGAAPITLGNFGTGITAYGLIIEGAVSGQGLLDGVNATAVDISGAGVNLSGGIHIAGSSSVTAVAYQANAVAMHLGSGVTSQTLENDGTLSATVTSAGTNSANALQIDAGASLASLINTGTIGASVTGDSGSSFSVVDRSGSLTSVTNYGGIAAALHPTLPGEALTGKAIALDLSANTTGVTLTQQLFPGQTILPFIAGDVVLGSGPNTVNLLAGSLTGGLNMGSGTGGSLTIDNGAIFTGPLTFSGSGLAIDVKNGTLQDNSPTTIKATSLHVGASSSLIVALDPLNNTASSFVVSGAATFDTGAKLGATVISTPSLAGQTFTIIKAGALSTTGLDTSLVAGLPFLFDGAVKTDTVANTLAITVRTKSPAELGFNKSETAAFNAIYAALPQDSSIQTAIVASPTRAGLVSAYDQLLPNSSGDVFETVRGMSRAVSRASGDRFDLSTARDDEDEGDFVATGFWASEFYSGLEQKKVDNNAYHSAALGVIGGYDFGGTGVTISAASANITRPGQAGDSLNSVSTVEAGLYAAPRFGALSIDARLGAGYMKASNRRQLVASVVSTDLSTTSTVTHTAEGDWSGYNLSAHLAAGLQMDVGKHLFFQPRIAADVFHLHESAYNERNGGAGYDFNLGQRTGTQTNGVASVVTGLRFGNLFVISPQLELGYDKVITGGPGATTARFAYGGPTFSTPANQIGGAAMGRLTLRGDGNYVHFSLQAGGEYSSNYHNMDMKAVFRLTF